MAHLHMVLHDGGQDRTLSFAAGATTFSLCISTPETHFSPFAGSEKIDALLIELKQAKEVVTRTQAAM